MLQTIGLAIVALGIIGLIWGIFQKMKAGRVADAPLVKTGDAASRGTAIAGNRSAISAEGNVVCQQPLMSPVTGTPCLYYSIKCTATWKDGDSEKSKELDKQKVAARFAIDDGSGPVWVDAKEGGDFEPTNRKKETKGTGVIGGITGQDIMFGNYRVQTGILAMGTKYEVEEEVMPLVQRVYACGKALDGGVIGSPNWRQLLLSNKSRDELLGSATKGAKMFLLGGALAFVAGSGLCLVGQFVLGDSASAETPSSTATAAAAAAPPAVDNGAAAAAPNPKGAAPAKPAAAGAKGAAPAKPSTTAAAAPAGATGAPATTAAAAPPKATGAPAGTAAPKK